MVLTHFSIGLDVKLLRQHSRARASTLPHALFLRDCKDVFKMARICLEAATQDDHDLLALMPGPYVQAKETAQAVEPVPMLA
jgi:hypothetical protein